MGPGQSGWPKCWTLSAYDQDLPVRNWNALSPVSLFSQLLSSPLETWGNVKKKGEYQVTESQ